MYVYLSWWLTAPIASGAPANYLDLINKLIRYREVDLAMAKKVMHKLSFSNVKELAMERKLTPLCLTQLTN